MAIAKELIEKGVRRGYDRFSPLLTGESVETREFLGLHGLIGNILQVGPGQYRAYVDVGHFNGQLLDQSHQAREFRRYSAALNSLTFPIQIVTSSHYWDSESYIREIVSKQTPPMKDFEVELLRSHIAFIRENSSQKKLLERKTVYVIPYNIPMLKQVIASDRAEYDFVTSVPDEVSQELETRATHLVGSLKSVLTPAHRMDDVELPQYLYRKFNPTTSRTDSLPADIMDYSPREMIDAISPATLQPYPRRLFLDGTHQMVLQIIGYGEKKSPWVRHVTNSGVPVDVIEYITPMEQGDVSRLLRSRYASHTKRLLDSPMQDTSTQAAVEDTQQSREDNERGRKGLFRFATYVKISGDTMEEMNKHCRTIESILRGRGIQFVRPLVDPGPMIRACMPIAIDTEGMPRLVNTDHVAVSHPFDSPGPAIEKEGVFWGIGLNKETIGTQKPDGLEVNVGPNVPIVVDRFSRKSWNIIALGQIRMGKDVFSKTTQMREHGIHHTRLIGIDPEEGREMGPVVRRLGGLYVTLSPSSPYSINPFDLPPKILLDSESPFFLDEQVSQLLELFTIMLNRGMDLDNLQQGVLEEAVYRVYDDKGITDKTVDPPDPRIEGTMPLLGNLYDELMRKAAFSNGVPEDPTSWDLAQRMKTYVKGANKSIFSQPTNVFLENHDVIGFNVSGLTKYMRPTATHILTRHIWKEIRRTVEERQLAIKDGTFKGDPHKEMRHIVTIGEAWDILDKPGGDEFLNDVARKGGHYDTSLVIVTQRPGDLLNSSTGSTILSNAKLRYLLHMPEAELMGAGRALSLSEKAIKYLRDANEGEALLMDDEQIWSMRMMLDEDEYAAITTKLSDIGSNVPGYPESSNGFSRNGHSGIVLPSGIRRPVYEAHNLHD